MLTHSSYFFPINEMTWNNIYLPYLFVRKQKKNYVLKIEFFYRITFIYEWKFTHGVRRWSKIIAIALWIASTPASNKGMNPRVLKCIKILNLLIIIWLSKGLTPILILPDVIDYLRGIVRICIFRKKMIKTINFSTINAMSDIDSAIYNLSSFIILFRTNFIF